MAEVEPFPKDAVSRAFSTLVEGICNENGYDLQYSAVESVDVIPVHHLTAIEAALSAAKEQLNQRMNKLFARFRYRSNLESPVHRLPADVLMMIFQEFKPVRPPANSSIFNLLLVCRTWYDIIIPSPQLWQDFSADMPLKIARLVIDRSRMHPVTVYWPISGTHYRPQRLESSEVLDMVIEHSIRIKKLIVRSANSSYPNIRKLIEAPMRLLEDLKVLIDLDDFPPDGNGSLNEFVLSEGLPLKHLYLRDIATPLDSPRLSNLTTLTLSGIAVPQSPQPLLRLLSSSQRLEELHIRNLSSSIGNIESSTPVTLPHLRKLVLWYAPSIYTAAILTSIHTPLCSHVSVKDGLGDGTGSESVEALDAIIWCPGSNVITTLVGGTDLIPVPDWLKVDVGDSWIRVERSETSGASCGLELYRVGIPQITARLGTLFSQLLPGPVGIKLHCFSQSIDLLPWSERVESLQVNGKRTCLAILQQLSQRHVISGTGEMDWICPRLSEIYLWYGLAEREDTPLDEEVLLSLVRQRWSGGDGLAAALQPTSFRLRCEKRLCPNLWSLEDEIKRIIPSFELYE
ncbi:hypothetical protein FRC04_011422 [Tulasnella sp. 424]|nr:hypothetical protein FRC04_011422 [Tulasnella sp. 424]KAG8971944.1 hypothetical protein FRC05_010479 [Tulasnella sp. 425]